MENKRGRPCRQRKQRCGPLNLVLYQYFVDYLCGEFLPTSEDLQRAGFKSDANHRFKAQEKFVSWSSKMTYDEESGYIVYKPNQKFIIPREKFDEAIMQAHVTNFDVLEKQTKQGVASGPLGLKTDDASETDGKKKKTGSVSKVHHNRLQTTIKNLQSVYTFGRRSYGMTVAHVHDVIRKCKHEGCVNFFNRKKTGDENVGDSEAQNDQDEDTDGYGYDEAENNSAQGVSLQRPTELCPDTLFGQPEDLPAFQYSCSKDAYNSDDKCVKSDPLGSSSNKRNIPVAISNCPPSQSAVSNMEGSTLPLGNEISEFSYNAMNDCSFETDNGRIDNVGCDDIPVASTASNSQEDEDEAVFSADSQHSEVSKVVSGIKCTRTILDGVTFYEYDHPRADGDKMSISVVPKGKRKKLEVDDNEYAPKQWKRWKQVEHVPVTRRASVGEDDSDVKTQSSRRVKGSMYLDVEASSGEEDCGQEEQMAVLPGGLPGGGLPGDGASRRQRLHQTVTCDELGHKVSARRGIDQSMNSHERFGMILNLHGAARRSYPNTGKVCQTGMDLLPGDSDQGSRSSRSVNQIAQKIGDNGKIGVEKLKAKQTSMSRGDQRAILAADKEMIGGQLGVGSERTPKIFGQSFKSICKYPLPSFDGNPDPCDKRDPMLPSVADDVENIGDPFYLDSTLGEGKSSIAESGDLNVCRLQSCRDDVIMNDGEDSSVAENREVSLQKETQCAILEDARNQSYDNFPSLNAMIDLVTQEPPLKQLDRVCRSTEHTSCAAGRISQDICSVPMLLIKKETGNDENGDQNGEILSQRDDKNIGINESEDSIIDVIQKVEPEQEVFLGTNSTKTWGHYKLKDGHLTNRKASVPSRIQKTFSTGQVGIATDIRLGENSPSKPVDKAKVKIQSPSKINPNDITIVEQAPRKSENKDPPLLFTVFKGKDGTFYCVENTSSAVGGAKKSTGDETIKDELTRKVEQYCKKGEGGHGKSSPTMKANTSPQEQGSKRENLEHQCQSHVDRENESQVIGLSLKEKDATVALLGMAKDLEIMQSGRPTVRELLQDKQAGQGLDESLEDDTGECNRNLTVKQLLNLREKREEFHVRRGPGELEEADLKGCRKFWNTGVRDFRPHGGKQAQDMFVCETDENNNDQSCLSMNTVSNSQSEASPVVDIGVYEGSDDGYDDVKGTPAVTLVDVTQESRRSCPGREAVGKDARMVRTSAWDSKQAHETDLGAAEGILPTDEPGRVQMGEGVTDRSRGREKLSTDSEDSEDNIGTPLSMPILSLGTGCFGYVIDGISTQEGLSKEQQAVNLVLQYKCLQAEKARQKQLKDLHIQTRKVFEKNLEIARLEMKFMKEKLKLQRQDASVRVAEAKAKQQEAKAKLQEAREKQQKVRGEHQEARIELQEAWEKQHEGRASREEEARAEQQEAKAKPQEARAEQQEAKGKPQEARAEQQEGWARQQEASAGQQEFRAEQQEAWARQQEEARAKLQEARAMMQEARARQQQEARAEREEARTRQQEEAGAEQQIAWEKQRVASARVVESRAKFKSAISKCMEQQQCTNLTEPASRCPTGKGTTSGVGAKQRKQKLMPTEDSDVHLSETSHQDARCNENLPVKKQKLGRKTVHIPIIREAETSTWNQGLVSKQMADGKQSPIQTSVGQRKLLPKAQTESQKHDFNQSCKMFRTGRKGRKFIQSQLKKTGDVKRKNPIPINSMPLPMAAHFSKVAKASHTTESEEGQPGSDDQDSHETKHLSTSKVKEHSVIASKSAPEQSCSEGDQLKLAKRNAGYKISMPDSRVSDYVTPQKQQTHAVVTPPKQRATPGSRGKTKAAQIDNWDYHNEKRFSSHFHHPTAVGTGIQNNVNEGQTEVDEYINLTDTIRGMRSFIRPAMAGRRFSLDVLGKVLIPKAAEQIKKFRKILSQESHKDG